jgi:hypothetical protein
MSIRPIGNPYGPQRPAAPAPTAPVTRATPVAPGAATTAGGPPAHAPAHGLRARPDSVTLSDTGRALAGAAGTEGASALTPERVADLRRKVLEGAYNQTGVVEQVANRLLSSGDV